MFRILVMFFVFIVPIQCYFQFNCNSCTCVILGREYTLANCTNVQYKSDILQSKDIQLGPNIIQLYMNKVLFKILPDYVFAKGNVGNLNKIELKACAIETIEKEAFRKLSELRILNLAFNNITYLSVGTFQDNWYLEELYCGGNKLEVLEDGLLTNLPFLKKVSFANNRIRHIGENFFAPTFNLKEILLLGNLLTYINGTMLNQLRNLQTLSISSNPWKCDCKLRSFQRMSLRYEQNIKPNCNNTNNPENTRGIDWTALVFEHFTCDPMITLTSSTHSNSSKVTLVCTVTANPKPTVSLYKINKTSKYKVRTKIPVTNDFTSTLSHNIEDINTEINNTYRCVAENKLGRDEKAIRVEEIKAMYVGNKNKPILKIAEIGDDIILECTRFIFKKTNIKWYFQNSSIDNTTNTNNNNKYEINSTRSVHGGNISTLIIKNIQEDDYGSYRCSKQSGDEDQYFEIFGETTTGTNLTLIIILSVILLIILIIAITLSCIKCRKRYQNEVTNVPGNETSKKVANDYVENKNYHMEESCIYISSDNNIYEVLK